MAVISSLITELRTDLSDDGSTRFTDTQLLNLFKKAIRRANRIVQRNGIQFGKSKAVINTSATLDYVALPADFDVWLGLFRDDSHKAILRKREEEWETIYSATALAQCLLDQANSKIYFNATPGAVIALTLWYFPSYDIASYTVASPTPWDGRLDDLIMEYTKLRALNIDEMDVTFDQALLVDFENQVIQSYGPNTVTIIDGNGWL